MSCAIAGLHASRDLERGGNCDCAHCTGLCDCDLECCLYCGEPHYGMCDAQLNPTGPEPEADAA